MSLLGNVFLGIVANHYADKAANCKASIIATNKIATTEKKIVEARQDKVKNETQTTVTDRISSVTQRVRNDARRQPDLPSIVNSPSGIDAEDRAPELFSSGITDAEIQDRVICTTNTILAEEWQIFYQKQLEIRADQNVDR